MTMNATPYPADVHQLVTHASAALRIWIAVVRAGRDCIDSDEAATLQTALDAVIDALNEACDDEAVSSRANALPLYRARDLLSLVDGLLWAFQGGDTAAPARADLLGTAELAAATPAKFDSVSFVPTVRASNVVSLALVRTEGPRPIQ